jgi:hypothetical protein
LSSLAYPRYFHKHTCRREMLVTDLGDIFPASLGESFLSMNTLQAQHYF